MRIALSGIMALLASSSCQLLYSDRSTAVSSDSRTTDSNNEPADMRRSSDGAIATVDAADCDKTIDSDCDGKLDGDRYGDVCDNCVGVSNDGQSDMDMDTIGNECDPREGLKDLIVGTYLVEGGKDINAILPLPMSGDWAINNQTATTRTIKTDNAIRMSTGGSDATTPLAVEVGFNIIDSPNAMAPAVGIRLVDGGGSPLECFYNRTALTVSKDGYGSAAGLDSTGLVQPYRLRIDKFNTDFRCNMTGVEGVPSLIMRPSFVSNTVSIFARDVGATINYVVIYAAAP
jgi:hypothetical protein